jgi:hypothetical protein
MNAERVVLEDSNGNIVAQFVLTCEEDGWFTGTVISQQLPPQLKKALDWYDEVVQNQMLSYLDEATATVEQFKLNVRYPGGSSRKVYSLHIDPKDQVTFRTTPVPPPAWLPKSESA